MPGERQVTRIRQSPPRPHAYGRPQDGGGAGSRPSFASDSQSGLQSHPHRLPAYSPEGEGGHIGECLDRRPRGLHAEEEMIGQAAVRHNTCRKLSEMPTTLFAPADEQHGQLQAPVEASHKVPGAPATAQALRIRQGAEDRQRSPTVRTGACRQA